MASKYLDLEGLEQFKQKNDAEYVMEDVASLPASPKPKLYRVVNPPTMTLQELYNILANLWNSTTLDSNEDILAALSAFNASGNAYSENEDWGTRIYGTLSVSGWTLGGTEITTLEVRIGEWNSGMYSWIHLSNGTTTVIWDGFGTQDDDTITQIVEPTVYAKDLQLAQGRIGSDAYSILTQNMRSAFLESVRDATVYSLFSGSTQADREAGWYGYKHGDSTHASATIWTRDAVIAACNTGSGWHFTYMNNY